jgi:hypothetical protein
VPAGDRCHRERSEAIPIGLRAARRQHRTSFAARLQANRTDIRIGRRCPNLALEPLGARTAVLLTAWNPWSRRMPVGWNHRMQRALLLRLRRFRVVGAQGSLGRWHEAMFLVAGDPRPLVRLAASFRQRAVVILRRGDKARVQLLG